MIQISKNNDKRANICKVDYAAAESVIVDDYPGQFISVSPANLPPWIPIIFSTCSFQESDEVNGEPVAQELSINIAGAEKETEKVIREICGLPVLIRLSYSNGEQKVVGTDDNPVTLSHQSDGSPIAQTIYCKRYSAEKAKLLTSF